MTKWEISPFGWSGISGVYCVCTFSEQMKITIHYIGSSKDIGRRILRKTHPYYKLIEDGLRPFIKFKEVEDYRELEKRLIARIKPKMNKQHNG